LQDKGVKDEGDASRPRGWPSQAVPEKKALIKAALQSAVSIRKFKERQREEAEEKARIKALIPRKERKARG
jgi:AMMECR1 domain-containing protein